MRFRYAMWSIAGLVGVAASIIQIHQFFAPYNLPVPSWLVYANSGENILNPIIVGVLYAFVFVVAGYALSYFYDWFRGEETEKNNKRESKVSMSETEAVAPLVSNDTFLLGVRTIANQLYPLASLANPPHRYQYATFQYEVCDNFDGQFTHRAGLLCHDSDLALFSFNLQADIGHSRKDSIEHFDEVQLRVTDLSGKRKLVPLPYEIGPRRIQLAIFILPMLPKGEMLEVGIDYRWPQYFALLRDTLQMPTFWRGESDSTREMKQVEFRIKASDRVGLEDVEFIGGGGPGNKITTELVPGGKVHSYKASGFGSGKRNVELLLKLKKARAAR